MPPPSYTDCQSLGFLARVGYVMQSVPVDPGEVADHRSPETFRDAAQAWKRPDGLTFSIVAGPTVEPERIVVRGELVNTTSVAQDVYLWDAGLGFFRLGFQGVGVMKVDVPQQGPREIYPEVSHLTLAPGAKKIFETALIRACWTVPPGTRGKITWALQLTGKEPAGELAITIP